MSRTLRVGYFVMALFGPLLYVLGAVFDHAANLLPVRGHHTGG